MFGRLSMAHRNSFEEMNSFIEKNLKIEGLELNASSAFRSNLRPNYFEAEDQAGFCCTLSNTNNQSDNFMMEDICHNNNSSVLAGLEELG